MALWIVIHAGGDLEEWVITVGQKSHTEDGFSSQLAFLPLLEIYPWSSLGTHWPQLSPPGLHALICLVSQSVIYTTLQNPALGFCWTCQGGHCLLQWRCQPRAVVSHLLLCGGSLTEPHGKEVELSDRGGRIQMTLYESLLCLALVRPISALLSYMSQYILGLCLYQLNFFFPVTWVAFLSAIECHPKQICVWSCLWKLVI